jgi:tRNA1Val (adenine37-N6)-methyltransferase
MPNSFFQFKQFRIRQDRAAMKVCTDACVLGAWAEVNGATRLLDIGAGTGLLALMAAQQNADVKIDAVELDGEAYGQALENVEASPWPDRIRVVHTAIQTYGPGYRYDLIISNPPFFQNHLRRPDRSKNIALHDETLTLPELAQAVLRLLLPGGRFVVLLPPFQSRQTEGLMAGAGLFPTEKLHIYDYTGGKEIRIITTYTTGAQRFREWVLYIRDAENQYTEEYVRLLKPYYLYL